MGEPATTQSLDESDLLHVCPWCDYSLRGLPVEHRCPECGGRLDRRWRVFRASSISISRVGSMLRLRWTIVAIFLLPVLILLLWLFRNEITTQIIGAVFLLGMFVQWLIGRRRTGFIGVSPEHLAIAQRRGRRVTLYSWPELHCAHMSKDSLIVTVCGPQIILFQVKPKGRLKECLRILRSHLFAAEAEPT